MKFSSRQQLTITPVIISKSENDSLFLPSISIAGRNRYRINKRQERLYGKTKGQKTTCYKKKYDTVIEYNETAPAQDWMSGARVEILRELQGCAGCGEVLGNSPIAGIPLFKEIVERPDLAIRIPEAAEKRRSFTRTATLNFKVNQSVLLADYMNNP